jgi:hypothetical protein
MKRSIVFGAGSSIGGCPLEEASEQERIPSIIGSIVWCCPTSRVFSISCVHVMVNGLWFILGILKYICRSGIGT